MRSRVRTQHKAVFFFWACTARARATMPSYTTAPDVFDIDPLGCFQGLSYLYLEPDFTTEESVPKILRRKCHSFFSIPYALPPTGERRFCKPQPLPSNYCYGTPTKPGIFDGSGGIKMCPQPGVDGKLRPETWDEDCLKLNLWIPSEDPRFDPAGYRPDDGESYHSHFIVDSHY